MLQANGVRIVVLRCRTAGPEIDMPRSDSGRFSRHERAHSPISQEAELSSGAFGMVIA
jgi:hypothetical protein